MLGQSLGIPTFPPLDLVWWLGWQATAIYATPEVGVAFYCLAPTSMLSPPAIAIFTFQKVGARFLTPTSEEGDEKLLNFHCYIYAKVRQPI